MTLDELQNAFRKVSLQHKAIESFDIGTSFDHAVKTDTQYPLAFLEVPYSVPFDDSGRFLSVNFAYYILFKAQSDDLNHSLMSKALDIGDSVISKISNDFQSELSISGLNGLSLNEFSDDTCAGFRFEMTVSIPRIYGNEDCYEDQFEADCEDC